MAPRQREEGEPPPVYGVEDRDMFTVAVSYGGYFLGSGSERSYIGGSMVWFDYCDRGYWWLSSVQQMLWDIGFDYSGIARAYWCLPGFEMMHNGLTEITSSKDTENMACAISLGNQLLCMYVDIDNNIEQSQGGGQVEDDIMMHPRAELPHVISPLKLDLDSSSSVADRVRIKRRRLPFDEESEHDSESDEEYVPELVDSDYHVSEDDNDLYDDDQMDPRDLKGKKDADLVEHFEEEDLQLPESEDDEEIRLKFRTFGPEDMLNPTFKVGQVFGSVQLLRKAIGEYTCKNRVPITMPTNDQMRLAARCEEGCPWYMWASYDNRSKGFMIKRLTDEHNCVKKWNVRAFSYKFIAEKYIETIRGDENISLRNLGNLVQMDWNMAVDRPKLGRARKYAQRIIYGDEDAQYNKLWDFAAELRRSNPGSTFYVGLTEEGRFKRCFFSFDAMKRGFMEGCRPVICLDGCHLKTNSGGILLTAVGVDPNDCIFPFAFGVVAIEDTESWKWFISTLKSDLGIEDPKLWTFMSDKQKGLIAVVKHYFPQSEHRFCVRHLWQNFNQQFRGEVLKNQLWKIARCTQVVRYNEAMEEMKLINIEAYKWLEEIPPNQWVKAFQNDWTKCDLLLNNISEVFNKYILAARELPIMSMIKRIFNQLMTRLCNKRDEMELFKGLICPKIQKKLDKYIELSNICTPVSAGVGVYSVGSGGRDYIVELLMKSCSCQRWNLTGIPCHHAIACMRLERINPVDHVHPCYSVDTYKKVYAHMLMPFRDMTEWDKVVNCPMIAPPKYDKKVGRKKKNRRKQPEEKPSKRGGVKLSRHGALIHCSHCGQRGHNRGGCEAFKAGMAPIKRARKRGRTIVAESDEEAQPVITQDQTMQGEQEYTFASHDDRATYANMEETMLDVMKENVPPPRQITSHPMPLPESGFIASAREAAASGPSVQNNIAMQAHAMKQEKLIEFEKRKEAAELKKLQDAENKTLEKQARAAEKAQEKKVAAQQRKIEAQMKKAQEAEQRKKVQEEKKAAQAAARAAHAEEKRIEQEKKKAAQAEAKAAQAAAKAASGAGPSARNYVSYPGKKVSMFDELR